MATLHLMVGLPCSGKTTRARKLEREQSALRPTTDEWHLRLFGQDASEPEHDGRHRLIEGMLWNVANRALALGINVILASEDELFGRLEIRNSQPSQDSFHIPREMMKPWIAAFERPTPDELHRRE